jgi:hypothetical protein
MPALPLLENLSSSVLRGSGAVGIQVVPAVEELEENPLGPLQAVEVRSAPVVAEPQGRAGGMQVLMFCSVVRAGRWLAYCSAGSPERVETHGSTVSLQRATMSEAM